MSLTWGAPPKVIVLQIGNCPTAELVSIVRRNAVRFTEFENDKTRSLLNLK